MRSILILISTLIAIFSLSVSATIINIPDDYATIQAGINASSAGDTVLVQPGTYNEYLIINDKDIILGSLLLTTGDTSYISSTVINSDSMHPVIRIADSPDTTLTITGFTLQNGYSSTAGGGIDINTSNPLIYYNVITENEASYVGGGICLRTGSNARVIGNTISNNDATQPNNDGGGIACYAYNAIISNNTIYGNSSIKGGGISFSVGGNSSTVFSDNMVYDNTAVFWAGIYIWEDCSVEITGNLIYGNAADSSGGGIACFSQAHPLINGNTIEGNSASLYGNGIAVNTASPTIVENIIRNNLSVTSTWGGGIYIKGTGNTAVNRNFIRGNEGYGAGILCQTSNATLTNNTVVSNDGDGIYFTTLSNGEMTNNISWGNSGRDLYENLCSLTVAYCDIGDTLWPGEGNISEDPMFVYPDTGNCCLQEGSPCIDAGDPDLPYDPDSTIADIGCFYYDQLVDINEPDDVLPDDFSLSQNYPNPFNAMTTISYVIPYKSTVTIDIYNALGRNVDVLIEQQQQPGYHQAIWNAANFSSGVYFYKLQADNYTDTRKMILLK